MEGLVFIGIILAIIYYSGKSSGFKEGKKKGSEAAYGAGLLEGASEVKTKDGGGCLIILMTIIGFCFLGCMIIIGL